VGRQGNENFPLGIETIALADFFSLSNRAAAYTKVAVEVAKLSTTFLDSFVTHLRWVGFGDYYCLDNFLKILNDLGCLIVYSNTVFLYCGAKLFVIFSIFPCRPFG